MGPGKLPWEWEMGSEMKGSGGERAPEILKKCKTYAKVMIFSPNSQFYAQTTPIGSVDGGQLQGAVRVRNWKKMLQH